WLLSVEISVQRLRTAVKVVQQWRTDVQLQAGRWMRSAGKGIQRLLRPDDHDVGYPQHVVRYGYPRHMFTWHPMRVAVQVRNVAPEDDPEAIRVSTQHNSLRRFQSAGCRDRV